MDSTGKTSRSQGISGGETAPEPGRNFQNQVASTINRPQPAQQPFFRDSVAAGDEQAIQTNMEGGTIPLQVNVCLPQLELNLTPEGLPPIQINLNLPPLQVNVTLPAPVFPLPADQPAPARVEIAAESSIQAAVAVGDEPPKKLVVAPELGADFLTEPWPESKETAAPVKPAPVKPAPAAAPEEPAAVETVVSEPPAAFTGPETKTHPEFFEVEPEVKTFAEEAPAGGEPALNSFSLPAGNLAGGEAWGEPANIKPGGKPASDDTPTPVHNQRLTKAGPATVDLTGPEGLFPLISSPAQNESAPAEDSPSNTDTISSEELFSKIFNEFKPLETTVPASAENYSPPLDVKIDWSEDVSGAPETAETQNDIDEVPVLTPLLEITPAEAEPPLAEPEDVPSALFSEELPPAPTADEFPANSELANSDVTNPDVTAFDDGPPKAPELTVDLNPHLEEIQVKLSAPDELAAKFIPITTAEEAAYSGRSEAFLPAHDIPKEQVEFADPDEPPIELPVSLEPVAEEAESPDVSDMKPDLELHKLNIGSLHRTPKAPPSLAAAAPQSASDAASFPAVRAELSVPEVTAVPVSAEHSAPNVAAADWPTAGPPAGPLAAQPAAYQPAAYQPFEQMPQIQAAATTAAPAENVASAARFPEKTEAAALPSEAQPEHFFGLPPKIAALKETPLPGTAGPMPLAPPLGLTPDDQARQAYQAVLAAMPPPQAGAQERPPAPVQAIQPHKQGETAPVGTTHQDFDFDLDTSDLDLDMSSLDF